MSVQGISTKQASSLVSHYSTVHITYIYSLIYQSGCQWLSLVSLKLTGCKTVIHLHISILAHVHLMFYVRNIETSQIVRKVF